MGGGYSGIFTGTDGAIGANRHFQTTMSDLHPVRSKSSEMGVMGATGGGGISVALKMKSCFCCENKTIPVGTQNETCPLCGWIDDPYQNKNPDSLDGKNPCSLREARERYKKT